VPYFRLGTRPKEWCDLRFGLVVLVVAALLPPVAAAGWGVPLSHRQLEDEARWSKAVGAPTRCVSQATDYAIASSIKQTWAGRTDQLFIAGRRHVQVLLSQRTCLLLRAKGLPEWAVIDAVFTLAHESVHVDGELSERIADCLGARRFERVARVAGFRFSKRAVAAFYRGNPCRR
jgi:hypothetical protein